MLNLAMFFSLPSRLCSSLLSQAAATRQCFIGDRRSSKYPIIISPGGQVASENDDFTC